MFDLLFFILISVFVPVIVFAGLKVYRVTDFRKITIGVSIAILAMEIIRFLCNAALYPEAETPKADIKFGYITVLVILILFATFRGGRSGKVFRDVAALTAFVPIVFAIMRPSGYINELDVNAVGKALYMLECGFALTAGLLYVTGEKRPFGIAGICLACAAIAIYAGIDAFIIWYWETGVAFDLSWYLTWIVSLLTAPLVFAVERSCRRLIRKERSSEA